MIQEPFTHRQRILAAFAHHQPDRIPLDLGSTVVTGISRGAYDKLKQQLGLDLGETKLFDRISQVAVIDEPVLELFQIDTRGVVPGLPENPPQVELEDENGFTDEWGLLRKMPPGADSYFVCNAPLSGELTGNDICQFNWPDPSDRGRTKELKAKIQEIRNKGDWAVLLTLPGNFITMSMLLRGFEDWYVDTALNPELIGTLMDQILEIQMEMCANILKEIGDSVDIVVNLDDLATQDRLLVSLPVYRRLLEPRLKRFYEFVKRNTKAKIMHHSDGTVEPILNSLIDMGIDAVNPLQVSAKGMNDVAALKSKYGSRLTFWGGIDTQHVLPFGSVSDVKNAVMEMNKTLNINGGYVMTSVHNIQNDVQPTNVIAMFEAALGHPLVGF
jgi:uroporphyrinogen decarboxylase